MAGAGAGTTNVAYTVGRFQPPTTGHKLLIQSVKDTAGKDGKAYVFVSSAPPDKKKNLLPVGAKLPLLRNMFPDVIFVNTAECQTACGGPANAFKWLTKVMGYEPANISIVLGKERLGDPTSTEYFGREAPLWGGKDAPKPERFVSVGHTLKRDMSKPADDEENMSGTKARGYVLADNSKKKDFYIALGYDPSKEVPEVETAYKFIYDAKFKPKTGGYPASEDDATIPTEGPDGEPARGGRRRTKRLTRNKASGRALSRRGWRSRTGSSKTIRSSCGSRGYC